MIIIKKYAFPFLYSVTIMLIGSLLTTILYYFNITSDKLNMIFIMVVGIIAIYMGALKLGKSLKLKGIYTGGLYFIFWMIVSIIIMVASKLSFDFENIIYYVFLFVFSILGAVIGKNLQEEKDA